MLTDSDLDELRMLLAAPPPPADLDSEIAALMQALADKPDLKTIRAAVALKAPRAPRPPKPSLSDAEKYTARRVAAIRGVITKLRAFEAIVAAANATPPGSFARLDACNAEASLPGLRGQVEGHRLNSPELFAAAEVAP